MRGTREPGPPYTPRPRTNASTHAHKTPTLTNNTHASMHACTMHADALWEEVASTSAIDVIKVRCASACCCWLASVRTARAMRASVLGAPRRRVCGPSSRPSTGLSLRSGHLVAACFVRAWWSAPMGSTRPCAKRWARLPAGGRCRPPARQHHFDTQRNPRGFRVPRKYLAARPARQRSTCRKPACHADRRR